MQQWQVARDEKAQYGLAVVATAMTHFGETARMTMSCSGQCEKAQWLLSGRPLRGGTVAIARYLRGGAVAAMLDKEVQWLLRDVMKRRTGYCKTVQWQLREHTLERLLE